MNLRAGLLLLLVGLVGCGGSGSDQAEETDEGALGRCINFGFLGRCIDDTPKTMPQGWPIPQMVRLYSGDFQLPMSVLEKPMFKPIETNPKAVALEVRTSGSDTQGLTCDKSGPEPGRCTFGMLVEASLVKDPATGESVTSPYAHSKKPFLFAIGGKVAELFLSASENGVLGPLTCKKTARSAVCETKEPFPAQFSLYTPNDDTSRALAEASLEPPTTAR